MASQAQVSGKMIELLSARILPVVQDSGYELFDIEFVKEGSDWFFRIYIDKEGGIAIDDCEIVSRKVEKMLDEDDPIPHAYTLEVSSPGIDRPLKKEEDFIKYAGEIVDIKLYKAIQKKKDFSGKLQGLKDGVVTITDQAGKELSFSLPDIASCRLAVIF